MTPAPLSDSDVQAMVERLSDLTKHYAFGFMADSATEDAAAMIESLHSQLRKSRAVPRESTKHMQWTGAVVLLETDKRRAIDRCADIWRAMWDAALSTDQARGE